MHKLIFLCICILNNNVLYVLLILYIQATSGSSSVASDSEEEAPVESKPISKAQTGKGRSTKTRSKDSEYIVTPDNYFMMNSSKKVNY